MAGVTYDNASEKLIEAVPELRWAYDELLDLWKGEQPGQYIVYGDILKPFMIYLHGGYLGAEILRRIYDFMEALVTQDDFDLTNLVRVGLLEFLVAEPDLWGSSQKFIGPRTLELAEEEIESRRTN